MEQRNYEEESATLNTKLFDLTEAPIKEWLANLLNAEFTDVFSDYVDNSDIIGFQENNIQYNAYVVTLNSSDMNYIDNNLIKNSEKVKKACSMLYDAVYKVFPAVIQTCNKKYSNELLALRVVFHEPTMSFRLFKVNMKAEQLKTAIQTKTNLSKILEEKKDFTEEQLNEINKLINISNLTINNITKDVMDIEEKEVINYNKKLESYDKLYIVISTSDDNYLENMETSMKRLPQFGLSYQDPDEENYIDKLKKSK
jgi:hypothetical protein